MPVTDLTDWIDDNSRPNIVWYAKRLSGNDTLANEANQAGPYVPKEFLFRVFPTLNRPHDVNPDIRFDLYIDSHTDYRRVRAVWYNSRARRAGTRNEARLTGFGGAQSAILDPESTGALTVFAFRVDEDQPVECHVWLCGHETEADVVEERVGPVEPGKPLVWVPTSVPSSWSDYLGLFSLLAPPEGRSNCFLDAGEIPPDWLVAFPSGASIIRKAVEMSRCSGLTPDKRLIKRRECEFEIFQSVEQAFFLPRVQRGFASIEDFVRVAHSVLQSRRSRAGKSLELHAREIFTEEGMAQGSSFEHNPEIEQGKRPDFLFPSKAAYEDHSFPEARLRMLAAKTTCKDRWRQILNEADRVRAKHLLTLQEGVSETQFREMRNAGVTLVVPQRLHDSFPAAVRPHLLTFESFIAEVRHLSL